MLSLPIGTFLSELANLHNVQGNYVFSKAVLIDFLATWGLVDILLPQKFEMANIFANSCLFKHAAETLAFI